MNIVDCLLLLANSFVVKVSSNICFRLPPDSVKHAFTFFRFFGRQVVNLTDCMDWRKPPKISPK